MNPVDGAVNAEGGGSDGATGDAVPGPDPAGAAATRGTENADDSPTPAGGEAAVNAAAGPAADTAPVDTAAAADTDTDTADTAAEDSGSGGGTTRATGDGAVNAVGGGSAIHPGPEPAPDGRRDRWAGHRRQRREELLDAAIDAIRAHGPDVGIDVIAAHAGVSKPVLYRYFVDKSGLWLAVGQRTAALVVDAITPAVAAVREDRAVVAAAVDAYLATIEADPHLYRFVVHRPDIPHSRDVVGDAVDTVAAGLARVVGDRLRALGLDSGPAQPWSYGMVGFVQAAGDWWLRDRQPIGRAALTDYLTMLLWGGVAGIRAAADVPGGIATLAAVRPEGTGMREGGI